MSAYAAVFLLKVFSFYDPTGASTHSSRQLLRSSNTLAQLHEGATEEIHTAISKTADAYHDASTLSSSSSAAAYHARFLKALVANDSLRAKQSEKERHQQQSARSSETRFSCEQYLCAR